MSRYSSVGQQGLWHLRSAYGLEAEKKPAMMLQVSVMAEVSLEGRPSKECRKGQGCDSRDTDLSSKPFGQ